MKDVAKRVNVTEAAISLYESDKRTPSYDVLIKLASLYDVSTDYLLGLEDDRASAQAIATKQLKPEYQALYESLDPFRQAEVRGYMKRIINEKNKADAANTLSKEPT